MSALSLPTAAVPLRASGYIVCPLTSARCAKIQRESEFAANVDCGWLSWGVGLLLVKPLKWTFSTLLGSSRVPLEEPFVIIELVKVSQTPGFKM